MAQLERKTDEMEKLKARVDYTIMCCIGACPHCVENKKLQHAVLSKSCSSV